MWMNLSQQTIFPGLIMLDELAGLDASKDSTIMRMKAGNLQTWSKTASDIVGTAASAVSFLLSTSSPLFLFN